MNQPAEQLPDLYTCIDPSIAEIVVARDKLDMWVQALAASRAMKRPLSLDLAAEEIVEAGRQIAFLAEGIHVGIAKRLALESRL